MEAVLTGSTSADLTLAGAALATAVASPDGIFNVWPMRIRPSFMPLARFSSVTLTPVFLATADSVSPGSTL